MPMYFVTAQATVINTEGVAIERALRTTATANKRLETQPECTEFVQHMMAFFIETVLAEDDSAEVQKIEITNINAL